MGFVLGFDLWSITFSLMEATVGGEAQLLYGGLASADLMMVGKRTLEWDPNAWKWDGDLFIARSLNPLNPRSRQFFPIETATPKPGAPSNSSSSCSDELLNMAVDQGKHKSEMDKRRRLVITEDDNLEQEPANLALNLGGRGNYPSKREVEILDGTAGKKPKVVGTNSSRAVCQVEDCGVDLSKAKDYHRRHKVCEMHSKASKAIVGNVMQRFCQQCSRSAASCLHLFLPRALFLRTFFYRRYIHVLYDSCNSCASLKVFTDGVLILLSTADFTLFKSLMKESEVVVDA